MISLRSPQSFSAYKGTGLVFTLGSFSKIFAPGVRLGWIHGSIDVMREFDSNGLLFSGGGMNPVMQGIMGDALEKQFVTEQLGFLRKKYRENAFALTETLRGKLPQMISIPQPEGGFFIWVELNPEADAEALLRKAETYRISFHPGNRFSTSSSCGNFVRLSFSYYDRDDLSEGARRFADLLKAEL